MKTIKIFFLTVVTQILMMQLLASGTYLDIDANKFEADESKNIIYFKGDVKMKKNKDLLMCQFLEIKTKKGKKNKQIPVNYKATGKVSFTINTKDNILKGRGDSVFYYPDEQKYIIIGNGYLKDTKEDKEIIAYKIYIDEKTGHTKIDGDNNQPVKFRLKLGDQ